ncbi:small nuclear ribonucleoprotein, putative [Babesia caballi]|uniref:Small nuclear ribonucleoprotein, putative n=1 Tax=Babesia caballi TaxID=5871 RepID=A0AAV4M1F3_BABCB|nr:small nuclear ribonucleoprotein, putative [Babesia caballi]
MDAVEQLRGFDAFRYIGGRRTVCGAVLRDLVQVHILLHSGEDIEGELYYVDLQRNQTIIIRANVEEDGETVYMLHAAAIARLEPLEPLNESLDDIPRIPPDELADARVAITRNDEEMSQRRLHYDAQHRIAFHKRWPMHTGMSGLSFFGGGDSSTSGEDGHWHHS